MTAAQPPRQGPPPRRDLRGRSMDGPVRLGRALGEVTSKLGGGRADVITAVFGAWSDIVGPAVAAHVRPSRIDDATLIVDADHPAWATQVRHLSAEILERVRDVCGVAGAPERIEVRVRA